MVISPYWDDINLHESRGVYYNSFTLENGADVLKRVQTFVMSNQSIDFTAKSVVVIKWMDVCPFGYRHCAYVSIANNCYSKLTAQNSIPIINLFCMNVHS